jgi:hypothetical protein
VSAPVEDHVVASACKQARLASVLGEDQSLPSASVQVTGADGPPKVTLVAPNGEKIDTPRS